MALVWPGRTLVASIRRWTAGRSFLPILTTCSLARPSSRTSFAGADLPNRWIRVAVVEGEAAGFITATLYGPEAIVDRDIIRDSTRRHIKIDILVVRRIHAGSVGRSWKALQVGPPKWEPRW